MKPVSTIDKCTTCATCVASCPVLRGTRTFKGPKLTGPSSERFRLLAKAEVEALDYCSNCKNCDITCPCGVQVSTLNMLARAEQSRHHKPGLRDWVLSHGSLLAKLSRIFGFVPRSVVNFAMNNPVSRAVLDKFGVDARAPLPVFAASSFATQFSRLPVMSSPKKVVFFPGCYINDYEPQTGLDVVALLQRAGYEVIVPDFQCCGVPLVANGFFDEAARLATHNAGHLNHWASQNIPIVAACPSCTLMLRQEYADMFPDVDVSYQPLVHDACAFIHAAIDNGSLQLERKPQIETPIYHEPCHLRAQGGGKTGLELLQALGLAVQDANADCCGISGSYGFKKEKYNVGRAVGAPLFEAVTKSQSPVALSECGTCRLQIAHHTGVRALHPLSYVKQYCL